MPFEPMLQRWLDFIDQRLRVRTGVREEHRMTTEKVTYCRICEQNCGLIATVDGGNVTMLRADKAHPITRGFACPKGLAMAEVQNDPERPVHPLKRQPDGSFEKISWEAAYDDIGQRLRAIRKLHGTDSIGIYQGNPMAFSYSALKWIAGMVAALESPHYYGSHSQDTTSRMAASALFYGGSNTIPVPDLHHTDFLFMLGANPVVSHGSLIAGTKIRDAMTGIVARGGRVVVVDPRRTETARLFEHLPVNADGDAWLLLSLLQVMFAEGLEDRAAIAAHATGIDAFKAMVACFSPEATEERSGVRAEVVHTLARDLAAAPSAAFYGRVGACIGEFSTLVNFLLDALNLITGNLDRRGGAVFPWSPIAAGDPLKKRPRGTYATRLSRIGGFPEVAGGMPAAVMADEITTPGPGQLRALIVIAGNPVLSVPDGEALAQALHQLDLLVALDIGVNETNRHADYILPTTTFLEREDLPLFGFGYQLRTYVQWTDPVVVPPRGEARQEWTIVRDICAELGLAPVEMKKSAQPGEALTPQSLYDFILRRGRFGDDFGKRPEGLSIERLRKDHPHGVILSEDVPVGILPACISHPDGQIHLAPPEILGEADRLRASAAHDDQFPLRLFGRRELRAINSWMKNAKMLRLGEKGPTCAVHPDDARPLGLRDGERARISSKANSFEVSVEVSDDVTPGSVCLPHGWGSSIGIGGAANARGGPNYNALTSDGPGAVEQLSGTSILNGIRVRLDPISLPH